MHSCGMGDSLCSLVTSNRAVFLSIENGFTGFDAFSNSLNRKEPLILYSHSPQIGEEGGN